MEWNKEEDRIRKREKQRRTIIPKKAVRIMDKGGGRGEKKKSKKNADSERGGYIRVYIRKKVGEMYGSCCIRESGTQIKGHISRCKIHCAARVAPLQQTRCVYVK